MFPLRPKKKARMPSLTTAIWDNTGTSKQCNKANKGNKKHTDQKGRKKLFLFADDMIVYIGNSKKTSRKQTNK